MDKDKRIFQLEIQLHNTEALVEILQRELDEKDQPKITWVNFFHPDKFWNTTVASDFLFPTARELTEEEARDFVRELIRITLKATSLEGFPKLYPDGSFAHPSACIAYWRYTYKGRHERQTTT